jgi:hypothetical protein
LSLNRFFCVSSGSGTGRELTTCSGVRTGSRLVNANGVLEAETRQGRIRDE